MKPLLAPLTAFALTLSLTGAYALNPEISFHQKAVSVEPPGVYENSQDAQMAIVGETVHLTYYSTVKVDNWTGAGTNRLWYRRSTDAGQTFGPATLLRETPTDGPEGTPVLELPYGTRRHLAVDGANVHVLAQIRTTGGSWHFLLDYLRSTNAGVSFELRSNLVVGAGARWIGNPTIVSDNDKVTIAYSYSQNWDGHTWMGMLNSEDRGDTFPVSSSIDLATWPGWDATLVDLRRSGDHVAIAWQNDYWAHRNAYLAASTNGGTNFTVSLLNEVNASGYGGVAFQDYTGANSGGGGVRPKLAWSGQNLYAVWTGIFTNDNSVLRAFLARSTNGGSSFLAQQCLSLDLPAGAGGLEGGHITVSAQSNHVYVLFNTANSRIFLKRSSDAGMTFQPIQEISDANTTSATSGWWNLIQADPNLADGSKVHLFTSDYYRVSSDGGATFSPAAHLSTYWTRFNEVNRAQMAIDQNGLAHFVWDSRYWTATNGTDYDDWDVFYRRFNPHAAEPSATNQALRLARGGFAQTRDLAGLRRDNLQIPNSPALAFSNAMTAELWVRPATNCTLDSKILQRESPVTYIGSFRLQTHSSGGQRRASAKLLTTNAIVDLWAADVLGDNEWHHLALTYDGDTNAQNARLYVDGHLAAAASASGYLDPRAGITWIGGPDETYNQFQGDVDELHFWNRALTAEEVARYAERRPTGSEPGLVACYPLDDTTRDITGLSADGVLMYQETFAAGSPRKPIITSSTNAAGQVRAPFVYQITAVNDPTGYGAGGLPFGLGINAASGSINGVPLESGVFNVLLAATNELGAGVTNLLLTIQPPTSLNVTNVTQPGPGLNDGTDDGSLTKGKDRSQYADVGNSPNLYLYNSPCNVGLQPAYLQFATGSESPALLRKAEIQVYCKMFFNGAGWPWTAKPYQISLRRVTASWNELTLPASVASTPLASRTVTAVGGGSPGFVEFEGWLAFDITALYRDWVGGVTANNGVQLALDTTYCANGNEFWVYSSDNPAAALHPKLIVESGPPPAVLGIVAGDESITLSWSGFSNLIYQVEASGTLTNWSPVGTPLLGKGGLEQVNLMKTNAARFYRLLMQ